MVGVPGRSKGCNTCIQRKIRCDRGTPICENCRKSKRLCTGYKRKIGYVLSQDMTIADAQTPNNEETSVTCQGRWRRSSSHQLSSHPYHTATLAPTLARTGHSFSLGKQVSSSVALREQFHYLFLQFHLPIEAQGPKPVISNNYFVQLQDTVIESPALDISIAAFFTARVARKYHDVNGIQKSRAMYVSGLDQLQVALRDPRSRLSDETLAACVSLMLYELTERPGGTPFAYIAHLRGARMLLELRGPDACGFSPLAHSIFLTLRSQTVVAALFQPHDTFLSRPEWLERPWKVFPKSPFERVLDVLFGIPALLLQYDAALQATDPDLGRRAIEDVIAKFEGVDCVLEQMYEKYQSSASGSLYWPELSTVESTVDDAELGKIFPISFQFPAFSVAQVLNTYWSGALVVNIQLVFAYNKLATLEPSASSPSTSSGDSISMSGTVQDDSLDLGPSSLRSRRANEKWKTMARNICQSVEYFLQDKTGGLGLITIFSSLRGCRSCFDESPDDCSRELRWTDETMTRVLNRFDFAVDNLFDE